jgi:hypothetical protein
VVSLVVEESSLHLRSLLVNQFNVEQGTFGSRILPGLLGMLLSDSGLNLPVEEEGVEGFDGSEALVFSGVTPLVLRFSIDSIVNSWVGDALRTVNFSFRTFLLLLLFLSVFDVREASTGVFDSSGSLLVSCRGHGFVLLLDGNVFVSLFKRDLNVTLGELVVSFLNIFLILVRVSDPVTESGVENARGFFEK